MNIIRIFRHVACEGPGYLADFLDKHDLPYEVIAIDAGAGVTAGLSGVAGLVFMGGPMSVNDPLPWIEAELDLIRTAVSREIPVLGHCLGGQLISRALGGAITANPVKEIGWHPVLRTREPDLDPWLNDLPERVEVFHWHGETFSLPDGARPLFKSPHCSNQAFALGNTLALQFHVEMTREMVPEWAALYGPELAGGSPTVQSSEEMTTDLERRITALHEVADTLYTRWTRPMLPGA